MSTDTTPHTPTLPARLERAAHEIAMMMQLNGHKDWRYGPIAERALTERLLAERDALRSALERIMEYAHDGARIRDIDPNEQPQFVAARAALKGGK